MEMGRLRSRIALSAVWAIASGQPHRNAYVRSIRRGPGRGMVLPATVFQLTWQRRRKVPLFLRGQGQALVCGLVRNLDAGGTVREYGLATGAEFVRNSFFQSRAILPFAPHRGVSCSTSLAHADTSFSFAPSQGREL